MERLASQGELQRHPYGPHSAHVELQRHQLGEEAEVPRLADHRVEAGYSDVQRDVADLRAVPRRIPQPLDTAEEVRGLHHLLKPEEPPEGQSTGYLPAMD